MKGLARSVGEYMRRQKTAEDTNVSLEDLRLRIHIEGDMFYDSPDAVSKSSRVTKHDQGIQGINECERIVAVDVVDSDIRAE